MLSSLFISSFITISLAHDKILTIFADFARLEIGSVLTRSKPNKE